MAGHRMYVFNNSTPATLVHFVQLEPAGIGARNGSMVLGLPGWSGTLDSRATRDASAPTSMWSGSPTRLIGKELRTDGLHHMGLPLPLKDEGRDVPHDHGWRLAVLRGPMARMPSVTAPTGPALDAATMVPATGCSRRRCDRPPGRCLMTNIGLTHFGATHFTFERATCHRRLRGLFPTAMLGPAEAGCGRSTGCTIRWVGVALGAMLAGTARGAGRHAAERRFHHHIVHG